MLSEGPRQRLLRDGSAKFGLVLVTALVLFALFAPLLGVDPNLSDFAIERSASGGPPGPSLAHPFGTDPLFRDVLARLAHGARLSLFIALSSTIVAMTLGGAIGIVAGYAQGGRWSRIDDILMRIVDVALAFPYLLLITAIGVAIDRADATTVIAVLGLTSWTGVSRVVRAKTMQVKSRLYIDASVALGATPLFIIRRHVLRAVAPILLVIGSQAMAMMILAEAVLSYLTVGIEPPHATWGRMLHEAETYIGAEPLLVAAPGLMIMIAVLGFTRLGDGLSDALDPKNYELPPRTQRLRYAADLAIIGLALVLVGFSGHDELKAPPDIADTNQAQARGGVLKLATSVQINTLDPAVAYDEASRAVNDLIFAQLVTWDHTTAVVPDLATFDVDGNTIVFTLKDGLTFHDGAPLKAEDMKRSIERSLHPKTPAPARELYRHIAGFEAFQKDSKLGLSGVTADDLTLTIQLSEPNANFLSLMALGFMAPVCKSMGLIADPKAPTKPCGAGAFKLKSFTRDERVVTTRFEKYHEQGKPYLDGVEWELAVPARTQRYRFETGDLHFIAELPGIDVFRFSLDERWAAHRHWVARPITHSIFLNTEMAPFNDRHLRRAVAFAVDPTVLEKVRANIGATTRLIPPAVPGPSREAPMRRHDLDAALEEMALAGYGYDPATGEGGYPHEIEYIVVPDSFEQAAAEVFQQQLLRIGLRLRLKLVAWATFLNLQTQPGRAQMGWRGWQADQPDPATFFEPILTSQAIQPTGSQNASFFRNKQLDDVVDQARGEYGFTKRMQLFERAEEIVRDEAPLIPVYNMRTLQILHPQVRGYTPHPVVSYRFRDVWLQAGAP